MAISKLSDGLTVEQGHWNEHVVAINQLTSQTDTFAGDISSLDSRVTTLENDSGGGIVEVDGVELSTTADVTDTNQWGTETLTFPNNGYATLVCHVGGTIGTDDTSQGLAVYIETSLDGGATFTSHSNTYVFAGGRQSITAAAVRKGTPTGNIVVRAMSFSSVVYSVWDGVLTATVVYG